MERTRPSAFEIPSEAIALHFARKFALLEDAMRPTLCQAESCLTIVTGRFCPEHEVQG